MSNHTSVLRNKRDATRYQILVEIAERQPAVSQQEVADAIGISSQAVSNHLLELVEQEHVEKHGRGRYEVTKQGVDWLISNTDQLRNFVEYVSNDIIGQVDVETVIATTDITEGEAVTLTMRDGVLRARAGVTGNATAVAVTEGAPGTEIGVTNVQGVVEYELGTVTVVSIPTVQDGGSTAVQTDSVVDRLDAHDCVAVAGVEALATANSAGIEVDIRFGSEAAVQEAATKGLDVLLLATTDQLSGHTDKLATQNISYEVIEIAEGDD